MLMSIWGICSWGFRQGSKEGSSRQFRIISSSIILMDSYRISIDKIKYFIDYNFIEFIREEV